MDQAKKTVPLPPRLEGRRGMRSWLVDGRSATVELTDELEKLSIEVARRSVALFVRWPRSLMLLLL